MLLVIAGQNRASQRDSLAKLIVYPKPLMR